MHPEQIQKIRDYLLANGQQELVGHFDLMVNEYNAAKAEALPIDDNKLDEGEAPEESRRISSQEFQDNAKKEEHHHAEKPDLEPHPNMDGTKE
jgi:hypothetical protein